MPVARSRFRVLVDRDDDRLNVVVTPPFPGADFGEGFDPRRVVLSVGVVPFQRLYHRQPPRTLPFMWPGKSFLSRSRSAHISSILASILPRRTSADAEEIPAR